MVIWCVGRALTRSRPWPWPVSRRWGNRNVATRRDLPCEEPMGESGQGHAVTEEKQESFLDE